MMFGCTTASIIPSSNPEKDAKTITCLLPDRYMFLEDEDLKKKLKSKIVVVEKSNRSMLIIEESFDESEKTARCVLFLNKNEARIFTKVAKELNLEIKVLEGNKYELRLIGGSKIVLLVIEENLEKELLFPESFDTLSMNVISHENKLIKFEANSVGGVEIETDYFVGKILFLLRNPNDTIYFKRFFEDKKRLFEIQVQGRLKRIPRGTVYFGGELTEPMELSLVSKGISSVILRMLRKKTTVHFSFGDDEEYSHIVFPLLSVVDNLIVTRNGEKPPEIGFPFVETLDSKQERKSGIFQPDWNLEYIYSFSIHSMSIDFPKWSIVNVPMISDLSLATFWGDSPIRIAIYENESSSGQHLYKENKYFMLFLLRYRQEDELSSNFIPIVLNDDRSSISSSFTIDSSNDTDETYFGTCNSNDADEIYFDTLEEESIEEESLLQRIDKVCPGYIDLYDKNGTLRFYAVVTNKKETLLYDYSSFSLTSSELKMFSPRLSSAEKRRRQIGLMLLSKQDWMKKDVSPASVTSALLKENNNETVARALCEYHWVEEEMTIVSDSVGLFDPYNKNCKLRIPLNSILNVQKMDLNSKTTPYFHGYYFFSIETLGRTHYFMVSEEANFIHHMVSLLKTSSKQTIYQSNQFLHKSTMFSMAQRRILNCRLFAFNSEDILKLEPCSLSELVLEGFLILMTDKDKVNNSTQIFDNQGYYTKLTQVLDSAAALKVVSLKKLNTTEKTAFFINLYHIMIMHAYLVLGPPTKSFKWLSYFNMISYQCDDDVFSLAELEHCIIRCNMNYPQMPFSKYVLPKSKYFMALHIQDFRINFALNCGSLSNPGTIHVYNSNNLDSMLDAATRNHLKRAKVQLNKNQIILFLPKICQWYQKDFSLGIVDLLLPFLPQEERNIFTLNKDKSIVVKYFSYSYKCQKLLKSK